MTRSRSVDRRYYGVVEALVVDVMDPAKEGRVKIRFPWFDNSMVTEWCRVSQPYAGKGYGAFFVPETRDEVLVAFVHGDMRLPVIVGGLYNGKDKPKTWRTKEKDQKLIRTKAGHEVLLDDSENDRRVRLQTVSGHLADLSDKDQKITILTKNGNEMILDDASRTITVKTSGGQSVVLDGNSGKVTVTGATVVLDSPSVQVGGATANVKVGGTAATLTPMLAELFAPIYSTHIHMVGQIPTTPPMPPGAVTPVTVGSKTVKLSA